MSTTTEVVPTEQAKVDKSGARIRRMFDQIAGRYDLLNHVLSGGTDLYWRWRAVRKCPPIGNEPILDVCTGTGDLAFAYAKRSSGPVIGTDFAHEMLVHANRKARRSSRGHTDGANVEFLEADTQRLPFDDDVFQIVSVAFGLRNVADTLAGLREMTRVCQPGGRVMVLEFSMPRTPVLGPTYRWYFRNVLPRIGQWMARNKESAYDYLPQSVSQFPEYEALGEIMQQAGLVDVEWTPLTLGVSTIYLGTKPPADAVDGTEESQP